ncbi:MAG: oxidoreductase domain protein [Devosia sp.]|nr:oxidoreductase domain protein [Devosia sp.]
MTNTDPIRWGILGPGAIAQDFQRGLARSRTGKLVAIGTRNPGKPGLAEAFPGARILDGYDALLADAEVEAIYIATPHSNHAEWAIKAAAAGKHILVEKPMALSAHEAGAIFHAAKKAKIFAGEAFMYRLHPQTQKLVELIGSGVIGEVRLIKTSFGFDMGAVRPEHRLFANDLAGGGIMDVGCYTVSIARLVAGAAAGLPFLDPTKVMGAAHIGLAGTDEWASAVLKFPNDIIAEVSCSIQAQQDNVLRIIGSEGRIEVPNFWFANGTRDGGAGWIDIIAKDSATQTISVGDTGHLFAFEADAVGEAIRAGRTEFSAPGMSWADTLGNLAVLDKWRADAGIEFGIETPARRTRPLHGGSLSVGTAPISKTQIAGLARQSSKVALGFEFFPSFAGASIMLDAFFERGGNLFDTGWIYQSGKTEQQFGDWQVSRGLRRDELLVIGKGAHSPLTYPDVIGRQLTQTLDRLQTDHVDVYFMHRDNLDVPVGEFVDAMDTEVKAGRIRGSFGGSNWSQARMAEAIAYAQRTGKTAPAALSNNFSLAEMQQPIWAGCVHCSDADYKAWLTETQIPNFAWSSQGRGFFTDRAGRDKRDNAELVNTWYSEQNFRRRDRAIELAAELNRSPIQIALAYVLAQPFPVVPLIGPRTLDELDDSLSALDIELTPEQVNWLEA